MSVAFWDRLLGQNRLSGFLNGVETEIELYLDEKPQFLKIAPLVIEVRGVHRKIFSKCHIDVRVDGSKISYGPNAYMVPADPPAVWNGDDYQVEFEFIARLMSSQIRPEWREVSNDGDISNGRRRYEAADYATGQPFYCTSDLRNRVFAQSTLRQEMLIIQVGSDAYELLANFALVVEYDTDANGTIIDRYKARFYYQLIGFPVPEPIEEF